MKGPRVVHRNLQAFDRNGKIQCRITHIPGQSQTALGRPVSKPVARGDFFDHGNDGIDIAPIHFQTVQVVGAQQMFFKTFHDECHGRSTGNGIQPQAIAQAVDMSHRIQIGVHDHGAKGGTGFIFRSGPFGNRISRRIDCHHRLATNRAGIAGLAPFEHFFMNGRTTYRRGQFLCTAHRPVFNGHISGQHAHIHGSRSPQIMHGGGDH